VVHSAVEELDGADKSRDALTRRLVRAQDLHLIDRVSGDTRTAQQLLVDWFKQQR
jgi:ABC-type thiamine transport system ATPase subunit